MERVILYGNGKGKTDEFILFLNLHNIPFHYKQISDDQDPYIFLNNKSYSLKDFIEYLNS